jgi:hypothetical protein
VWCFKALGEAIVMSGVLVLRLAQAMQVLSLILLGLAGLILLVYTLLCTAGVAPWLTFEAQFGTTTFLYAGQATQIGVTTLLLLLFFFIPSQARLLTLERSHRNFRINMDDVARAYHLCHTADRAGVFTLSSEFDAVRERLAFLRDHPDMAELETDLLTVAAQMSQQARRLADVYSDEKVARAKDFLRQRQAEAETQQARIVEAQHTCREIRKWAQQVDLEESIVASQLARLDDELQSVLPALGYSFEGFDSGPEAPDRTEAASANAPTRPGNVVALAKTAAE